MQKLPHQYTVRAEGRPTGSIITRALEKAGAACLVTNSLSTKTRLEVNISTG